MVGRGQGEPPDGVLSRGLSLILLVYHMDQLQGVASLSGAAILLLQHFALAVVSDRNANNSGEILEDDYKHRFEAIN